MKCAYGGRGSGKSWAVARSLLAKAIEHPIRVLCAREIQKSIKQSVHTLLTDQIEQLGYSPYFQILENEIRSVSGAVFSFTGLNQHTVDSIKSYEGVDVCWVEEAQTVSRKSWTILIPTIRKPMSEIWVTFNPDTDSDDTYRRFVLEPPPDSIVVKVNYYDNPWFPEVLEHERAHAERTLPGDEYRNIWEGECRATVEGAIYAHEVRAAQEEGRICNVPLDPLLKTHVVFDLGWNDSMFIGLVQRGPSDIRIVEVIEDDHRTLDWYSNLLREKRLNWGTLWLPHDGETKDFKTGKSAQQILERLGWTVKIIPRGSVEDGIRIARMTFGRCWFDKTKAGRVVDCLKHYRRKVSATTNEPGDPLHDEYSHGADMFRYLCMAVDQMTNEDQRKRPPVVRFQALDPDMGY